MGRLGRVLASDGTIGRMAAFLLLSTDTDLTLGDIEAWAARARALGASAASPVQLGEPPLSAEGNDALTLSVPVVVSRTILPGDEPEPRDEPAPRDESQAQTRSEPRDAPESRDGSAAPDGLGRLPHRTDPDRETRPNRPRSRPSPDPPEPRLVHPSLAWSTRPFPGTPAGRVDDPAPGPLNV